MSTYSNLDILEKVAKDDYVLVIEQDGSIKKITSSKIPSGLSATIIEYSSSNSGNDDVVI